ncbi:MBL fold metallo-hydrolase [Sediminibacterium sp.]|uniref:MBL fold metallo-hydrolase n=1 Tax=Sediminibacterium sp. TaxID=1917865 RepID=UPI0027245C0A|nr:MBL fold metallo-hydrolase [Sediminibacterium sp.]MDO9156306.1 MBL fold metallo-hydrolase [Sediminibacterium sp.]MDP2422693.1 MBL fold metallo-hydrolase [Sediminibacterium sp.]
MKLYSINHSFFKLDGGAMYGVVPKSLWNKLNPADENNLCNWALRSLLIQDENKLILIDTGMGFKQDEKFFGHYGMSGTIELDAELAQLGFSRNDITDVFHTHLHFDHCGGSIERLNNQLVPYFPTATYWSNPIHWDWAVNPNDREKASFLKDNILPIQASGQLKMIDAPANEFTNEGLLEKVEFTNNISIRFVNGHTKSMMLPQINYNGKTIVYMADLLPSASHIPLPYIMGYDMFPLTTLKEKKTFLQEAAERGYILFFEHDPSIECCTVHQTEKGIRMNQAIRLTDL